MDPGRLLGAKADRRNENGPRVGWQSLGKSVAGAGAGDGKECEVQFLYGAGQPEDHDAAKWGENLSIELGAGSLAATGGAAGAASSAGKPPTAGPSEPSSDASSDRYLKGGRTEKSVKRGVSRAHYKLSEALLRFGLLPSTGRAMLLPASRVGDAAGGVGSMDSECKFDPSSPVPPTLQLADRLPMVSADGISNGPLWDVVEKATGVAVPRARPGPRRGPYIAMDLGASPGGWSELLADQGTAAGRFHAVHGVDPGDLAVPLLGAVGAGSAAGAAGAGAAGGSGAVDARGVIHWKARAESAIAHMLCRAGIASDGGAAAQAGGLPIPLSTVVGASSAVGNSFELVRHSIGEVLRLAFTEQAIA